MLELRRYHNCHNTNDTVDTINNTTTTATTTTTITTTSTTTAADTNIATTTSPPTVTTATILICLTGKRKIKQSVTHKLMNRARMHSMATYESWILFLSDVIWKVKEYHIVVYLSKHGIT